MRFQPYASRPTLRGKKPDSDYYSGPKRRKRRAQEVEVTDSFEDKVIHRVKHMWHLACERRREATAIVAGLALVVAATVWFFVKEAEQERQSWARLARAAESSRRAAQDAGPQGDAKESAADVARQHERIMRDCGSTSATPYVHLQLGNSRYGQGDFKRALADYQNVARQHPGHFAAGLGLLNQAYALEELHQFDEAAAVLARLQTRLASSRKHDGRGHFLEAQVLCDRGRCLEAAGKPDAAQKQYAEALKTASDPDLVATVKYRLDQIAAGASLGLKPPAPAKPRAAKPTNATLSPSKAEGAQANADAAAGPKAGSAEPKAKAQVEPKGGDAASPKAQP